MINVYVCTDYMLYVFLHKTCAEGVFLSSFDRCNLSTEDHVVALGRLDMSPFRSYPGVQF